MNIEIGKSFRADEHIVYMCPTCKSYSLTFVSNSFISNETAQSQKHQEDFGTDPETMQFKFTAWLKCNNQKCNEAVTCVGNAYVDFDIEVDHYGEQRLEYHTYYRPIIFSPTLMYFLIPEKCPETVTKNLIEAFQLTLLSPNSAANHVRVAVENLLTALNVPRTKIVRKKEQTKGTRERLNLHQRILLAKEKNILSEELKDLLLAIKWIGNDGSHGTLKLTKDDIYDAYQMIKIVLEKIYISDDNLQKKVRSILKHKGIKKPKM